ncbi:non-ribosomal peptide synthetase [Nocardia sp. NPDC020380]|uniref:non-ribosomal peptide synthetase n=1 Tax=Nocardia sp. NPDC020380 TaxID=3364309 RepID=UPI00378A8DE3
MTMTQDTALAPVVTALPAAVAVRFDAPAPSAGDLAELVATALGLDPAAIGIWSRSVPFAASSAAAARIVRQQLGHSLDADSRVRLTCTRYSDGVADVVLSAAAGLGTMVAEFDRLGARPLTRLSESPGEPAGISDIELAERLRNDEFTAAVVITLARFLDTAALSVDLVAADSALQLLSVKCEVDSRGSVKSVVSQLNSVAAAASDGDRELRAVRVVDYTGAPGTFLPESNSAYDFDIAIRPVTPATARIEVRGRAGDYLDQLAEVTGLVYRQIRDAGLELAIRDITYSTDSATIPLEAGQHATASGRIEQRVAAHAAAHPESIAVLHGSAATTFRALDELSDRIAAGLLTLGVRPGDFVVTAAQKSAGLFALMLGIWKCGGAYVPVDIEFPIDRLTYIIEDSRARVAVVDAKLLDSLPDSVHAVALSVLIDAEAPAVALPRDLSGQAPAYAIYTSGTTGRPKGTVIAHSSVLALIDALAVECALTENDVWSVFHSPAFDFSVWEIWGALITGGTAAVVAKDTARDPARFHALLRSAGVTVLSQTPSAFTHLVDYDASAPLLNELRLVILGGEALQAAGASAWLDRYPERRCRLVNMYGITETTVHVTVQMVSKHIALHAPRAVGRAIPGWHYAVMGPDLRPAPPGFPGEIHVAGAGLALYYSDKPALTATKFVAGSDGRRWYRSGDLGRIRADGTLEHLGRIDHQVKINGYRIELDEIRNSIMRYPGIRDAAVVCAASGRFGTLRLVAYVVGAEANTAELRAAISRVLPSYMHPASYTVVESIPLTTNGKVDVARLPDPHLGESPADPGPADEPEAAEVSATQSILAAAWSEVLGNDPQPEDNFFLSGGNSLAAIHLSNELTKNAVTMPLTTLYKSPVFKDLVAALSD